LLSRRLGITQLAISNYLHSKRGKAMQNLLRRDEEVMMLVGRLAKAIYKNESITQEMVCEICALVRIKIRGSS